MIRFGYHPIPDDLDVVLGRALVTSVVWHLGAG